MQQRILIVGVILFSLMPVFGQDKPAVSPPDLQERHEAFFDPYANKRDKEEYRFRTEWRMEAGYRQIQHRTPNSSYENLFMHGARAGFTVDFILPYRFSIQTGVLYTFTYGKATQKWGPMSYEDFTSPDPITKMAHSGTIRHRLYEHQLTIPVQVYYNIKLWRQLNMFFYTGPLLNIGVAMKDDLRSDLSEPTRQWLTDVGQPYEPYDRYKEKELHRFCIQWGLGGGFEWDRYRLQAGYDFGLNNLIREKRVSGQKMQEWGWTVAFSIRIN